MPEDRDAPRSPRLNGTPECVPDSVMARLQAIADEHPDAECVVAGGLSDAYDPRAPLLPVTSAAVEGALRRIMADTGFTPEQIRTRFPGDELP